MDIGTPVVAALGRANEATREKIKREVYGTLEQKYVDGNIMIDSSALVISGEK